MHLNELHITNCFGFASTSANLSPSRITILGRNSSGKTALLDAINNLAPGRVPQDHPRFRNFRPTEHNPLLTATFTITQPLSAINVSSAITREISSRGVPQQAINDHNRLQAVLTQTTAIYQELTDALNANGTLTLTKFTDGTCQLTVEKQYSEAKERRKIIDDLIQSIFPSGTFTVTPGTNHGGFKIDSTTLDREASEIIPPITYYNQRYNLIADLPDHLTTTNIKTPPNEVARAFATYLDTADVASLLTNNDPDEQERLRAAIQERANTLATTISRETSRLLEITLSPTPQGLQITMRTDGKKSFYRHLSDATKFLFAYHLHAEAHHPGAILLFDEPSNGLHASAATYLRDFLQRLSTNNQVIVATHDEHLLDIEHLDQLRLMQQDENDRPIILNSLRPPRDRKQYLLALQPVFDAIGLAHSNHTLTRETVVITEGITDYLYLRALHELTGTDHAYGVAPGRGDGTFFTLVPFMASQGIRLKIILDTPDLKAKLQESYGLTDDAFFIIPGAAKKRGIEDLFTPLDYQRLLAAAGYEPSIDELSVGNSTYAKQTDKRLVAQIFRKQISNYQLGSFEEATRANITTLIAFCSNDNWFTI